MALIEAASDTLLPVSDDHLLGFLIPLALVDEDLILGRPHVAVEVGLTDVRREGHTYGVPESVVVDELSLLPIHVQLVGVLVEEVWRLEAQRVHADGLDLDEGGVTVQAVAMPGHAEPGLEQGHLVVTDELPLGPAFLTHLGSGVEPGVSTVHAVEHARESTQIPDPGLPLAVDLFALIEDHLHLPVRDRPL